MADQFAPQGPDIYNYTDYRKFLVDTCSFLVASRARRNGYTYKSISEGIGIKSPGHFTLILQGKTRISTHLAEKICRYLRLRAKEMEYFLSLVHYNQTASHEEKARWFEKVISFPKSCVSRVNPQHYQFYGKWYHCAIRSLVECVAVRDNFNEIARMVVPAIRPDQAQSSIRLLEKLDMIEKGPDGYFRLTRSSIDTGSEVPSVAVNGFAVEMLQLAREALDTFPRDQRVLSWVTFATSEQGYREILDELRTFRLKAAEIARKYPSERVYQANMQVFPLSKPIQGVRQ